MGARVPTMDSSKEMLNTQEIDSTMSIGTFKPYCWKKRAVRWNSSAIVTQRSGLTSGEFYLDSLATAFRQCLLISRAQVTYGLVKL